MCSFKHPSFVNSTWQWFARLVTAYSVSTETPFPSSLPCTQLETRIDRHQEVARELLREGKRDRALVAIKKKKMTEKQLEHLSAHVLNVEGMVRGDASKGMAR